MTGSVIERGVDFGAGGPGPMAVFAIAGLHPAGLAEPSLVEVVGLIDEQIAWLASLRAAHLAELTRRHADDVAADLSALAPGEWRDGRAEPDDPQWEREGIGLRCGITAYEARTRLETATALETRLPATGRLLAGGALSWAHAVALAQETAALDPDETGRVERRVHADARAVTAGQVRRCARRLVLALRPPPETADPERSLVAWRDETGVDLQVRLTHEGGAAVTTCLDTLATRTDAGDDRPIATRRADALVELCRARLDAGSLPRTAAGIRPHLTLQVPLASLAGVDDQPATAGAVDLTAEAARRLACDAGISVLLHDTCVVDLGREQRLPSPSLRRRLEARDGGCRFPTCDRDAGRCDAHHVVHWARGGCTDEANLVLLCARHHHLVHEGGWRLAFDGAVATWTTPAGRTYTGPSPLARPPEPEPGWYGWLPEPPRASPAWVGAPVRAGVGAGVGAGLGAAVGATLPPGDDPPF